MNLESETLRELDLAYVWARQEAVTSRSSSAARKTKTSSHDGLRAPHI